MFSPLWGNDLLLHDTCGRIRQDRREIDVFQALKPPMRLICLPYPCSCEILIEDFSYKWDKYAYEVLSERWYISSYILSIASFSILKQEWLVWTSRITNSLLCDFNSLTCITTIVTNTIFHLQQLWLSRNQFSYGIQCFVSLWFDFAWYFNLSSTLTSKWIIFVLLLD